MTPPNPRSTTFAYASVKTAALSARAVGISTIPIRADGSKKPALGEWNPYRERYATDEEIEGWYRHGGLGLAMVCGRLSHNLEVMDFDDEAVFALFLAVARAAGLGPLVDKVMAGYYERSPRGHHLPFFCDPVLGNTKLARYYETDQAGDVVLDAEGSPRIKTRVEVKSEGGYIICCPSNGAVHETGRAYQLISGGFHSIVTLTPLERQRLYAVARVFDEVPEPSKPTRTVRERASSPRQDRPGDVFASLVDWSDILKPAGWTLDSSDGEEEYWTRPGKDSGTSATTNYQGSDLMFVFTSSTKFTVNTSYSKFAAWALINYNGDFSKAASALRALGYGAPQPNGDSNAPADPQDEHDLGSTPLEDGEIPDPEETPSLGHRPGSGPPRPRRVR
jgi:putative DNA primase/helicase